jgi:hypothetical protein
MIQEIITSSITVEDDTLLYRIIGQGMSIKADDTQSVTAVTVRFFPFSASCGRFKSDHMRNGKGNEP